MAYTKKGKMFLTLNKQTLASQMFFMGCEERGAYFSLLIYQGEYGFIPRNSEEMAKICSISRETLVRIWPKIKPYLDNLGDDKLHFPWLTEEMEREKSISQQRSIAGHGAAEKRWSTDINVTMDNKTTSFVIHAVIPNFRDIIMTMDNKTTPFVIRPVILLLSAPLYIDCNKIKYVSHTDQNGIILPASCDMPFFDKKLRGKVGTVCYYNNTLVDSTGIGYLLSDKELKFNTGIRNYLDFISKKEIKNFINKSVPKKVSRKELSVFDEEYSRKMAALIMKHVHRANFNVKHNPNVIRLLRTADGVSEETLEKVYKYFAEERDWEHRYNCVVESLQTFREKFSKIMGEISRKDQNRNLGLKTTKFEVGDKKYDENQTW